MPEARDRLARFEAWARAHRPALRAQDRKRVAEELFEMVGDEVVLKLDVDHLMKRYRDGLLGAQAVMLVRKVGDDILAWQEAELAELHGERDDEGRASDDDVDAAWDRPPSSAPPPSARAWARRSERPSARPASSDPEEEPERRSADERERGAPRRGSDRPPTDPAEGADEPAEGLDASARDVLSRWTFDEEDSHVGKKRSRANEWDETSDVSTLWKDKSGVGTVSRRLRREEDDGAPAPTIERVGRSEPPPGTSASPRSEPPPSSLRPSAPPGSVRPAPRPTPAPSAVRPSTVALAGGALLVALFVAYAVRRGWLSRGGNEEVTGLTTSSHLHLTMRFGEGWSHATRLDHGEIDKAGWDRRESVYYQGASAEAFERKIGITVFEKREPATEDDLRTLGVSQLDPEATLRDCVPLVNGRTGVRCQSVSGSSPTLEEYFLLGKRVVFVRGAVTQALVNKEQAEGNLHPFQAIDDVCTSIDEEKKN